MLVSFGGAKSSRTMRGWRVAEARRATIAEVAQLAGVHAGTASRALNARTRAMVNADTVLRVEEAAKRLGYVPNALARGLRTRNSMTIGVVIPDITNPFFPPVVRGIEAHLQPHGYSALIANTDGFAEGESGALRSLLDRRVDGLIVASGQREETAIAELYRSGVKVVLLNRDAGPVPYPLVAGNDASGIAAAVESLVELGHRRLVHVAGPMSISTSASRAQAFEASCSAHEGVVGTVVNADALSIEAGRDAMLPLLRNRSHGITGVIASTDLIAVGILRAMKQMAIQCPRDMSVIGFNDVQFAEDFCPPLSTIRVPTTAMGERAARLLLDALNGGDQMAETVMLPVSLVLRDSTGPAPVEGIQQL
ncbi:LacI family DNA-binding transcriptional regulator [Microbacterium sp. LWH3-1.2]|uniref:LacI family DNA-binding transcriptional regulator n=1 Tax=Microbacterium sp. LWH3-1.2 TaxID=3135256 RepID=UPI0034349AA5